MAGCSPDGMVGKDGLVEIKCPNTATMIEVLLGAPIDLAYASQCIFRWLAPAGNGAIWSPMTIACRAGMQMHIMRIARDDKIIEKIELEVQQFLIDLDATVDLLRKRYMQEAA